MKRTLLTMATAALLALGGVSCGSDEGGCGLPDGMWSTAHTGQSCQVNIFGDTEYAAYCSENQNGGFNCACGAAAENPLEFTSEDLCDLDGQERICEAVAECGWQL